MPGLNTQTLWTYRRIGAVTGEFNRPVPALPGMPTMSTVTVRHRIINAKNKYHSSFRICVSQFFSLFAGSLTLAIF